MKFVGDSLQAVFAVVAVCVLPVSTLRNRHNCSGNCFVFTWLNHMCL